MGVSLARALLLAVGLVAAQRQVRRHLEDARGGEHGTSMLGLKLASSGSTWWVHELKAQRGIVVEEELFTSTSHMSQRKREDKMVERLARCDGGVACGFTISPKNSPGVDWRRVGRAAGCVVAWERSNLAKTVVSIVSARVPPRSRAAPTAAVAGPEARDPRLRREGERPRGEQEGGLRQRHGGLPRRRLRGPAYQAAT